MPLTGYQNDNPKDHAQGSPELHGNETEAVRLVLAVQPTSQCHQEEPGREHRYTFPATGQMKGSQDGGTGKYAGNTDDRDQNPEFAAVYQVHRRTLVIRNSNSRAKSGTGSTHTGNVR